MQETLENGKVQGFVSSVGLALSALQKSMENTLETVLWHTEYCLLKTRFTEWMTFHSEAKVEKKVRRTQSMLYTCYGRYLANSVLFVPHLNFRIITSVLFKKNNSLKETWTSVSDIIHSSSQWEEQDRCPGDKTDCPMSQPPHTTSTPEGKETAFNMR